MTTNHTYQTNSEYTSRNGDERAGRSTQLAAAGHSPHLPFLQVVLALDDSRSMAENRCGALALEALTCIARAMSRLEVGELGVLSFGTSGERGVRILHPLGAPFTDAAGPGLVSSFTFAGEHTVADAPVGALLDTLDVQLTAARESHSGGNEQLQQLVLIIAGVPGCISLACLESCANIRLSLRWPLPREGVAAPAHAPP